MTTTLHKSSEYKSSPLSRKNIELIQCELPIAEIAGEFTDLRKSKTMLIGKCPFCDESSDSFTVFPGDNSFYCESCLREGDVFQFLMEIDHVTFRDAFKIILSRYCGL